MFRLRPKIPFFDFFFHLFRRCQNQFSKGTCVTPHEVSLGINAEVRCRRCHEKGANYDGRVSLTRAVAFFT